MEIRKIIFPFTTNAYGEAALTTALRLAKSLQAHLVVLVNRPDAKDLAPFAGEGLSGAMLQDLLIETEQDGDDRNAVAYRTFIRLAKEHNVKIGPVATDSSGVPEPLSEAGAEFLIGAGSKDKLAVQYARVADLAIVPHPDHETDVSGEDSLHAILFDSGQPVILAPPSPVEHIGKRVAVAWNASAEAAAALSSALPWLKRAEAVMILEAGSEKHPVPSVQEVRDYLALHGIKAETKEVKADKGTQVGAALLEAAYEFQADLFVLGAYSHSRLRQLILGGVTRYVLNYANIPVLMHR